MPIGEESERDQHHLRNRGGDVVKDPVRLVADLTDDGLIGFERIERSNRGRLDEDRALPNEEEVSGCGGGVVGSFDPLIGAVRRATWVGQPWI